MIAIRFQKRVKKLLDKSPFLHKSSAKSITEGEMQQNPFQHTCKVELAAVFIKILLFFNSHRFEPKIDYELLRQNQTIIISLSVVFNSHYIAFSKKVLRCMITMIEQFLKLYIERCLHGLVFISFCSSESLHVFSL